LEARTLLSFSAPVNFPAGAFPEVVRAADLTGTGTLDLVVLNAGDQTLSVLPGNGDGSFQSGRTYATGPDPSAIAVGNFTNDAISDLAVANFTSGTVSVYLGNGDRTFQDPITFATGSSPTDLAVGDFNGDGHLDLIVANGGSSGRSVSVWLGNGDGTFQAAGTYDTGGLTSRVVAADLRGDGISDLAVAGTSGVGVLLGNGDGSFQAAQPLDAGRFPLAIAAGDLTGSGIPDLAVTHFDGNTVSVLLGNGDGSFQPPTDYTVGNEPHASPFGVQMVDLTGSGTLKDLVTANYNDDNVSVLLGNGDGTFQAAQNFATDVGPTSVAMGDFNTDGFPDLASANALGGTVTVLLNQADWQAGPRGIHLSPEAGSAGETVTGLPAAEAARRIAAQRGQSPSPAPAQAAGAATVADQESWERLGAVVRGADQPAATVRLIREHRTETADAAGLADRLAVG
jgi:hypothetical protein